MILSFKHILHYSGSKIRLNFRDRILSGVKVHTIRKDTKNRWKKGQIIDFAINVRTPNYHCFKKDVCDGVQKITIAKQGVWVDGRRLMKTEVTALAIRDGFDSVSEFYKWFEKQLPFRGKIIHWTHLRY